MVVIFSYLKIKDLNEVSSVCKTYYLAVRQNKFFRRKLLDSKTLFNNERFVFDYYYDSCVCFSYDLCEYLMKYVCESNLHRLRDVMVDKVYYSILPFRIWNHIFLCKRSQYVKGMCLDCTKLYIRNKKISNHINDNLIVNMIDFPCELTRGIVCANKIYIYICTYKCL